MNIFFCKCTYFYKNIPITSTGKKEGGSPEPPQHIHPITGDGKCQQRPFVLRGNLFLAQIQNG